MSGLSGGKGEGGVKYCLVWMSIVPKKKKGGGCEKLKGGSGRQRVEGKKSRRERRYGNKENKTLI